MHLSGLKPKILAIVNKIDYDNADDVEDKSATARAMVMQTRMPSGGRGQNEQIRIIQQNI